MKKYRLKKEVPSRIEIDKVKIEFSNNVYQEYNKDNELIPLMEKLINGELLDIDSFGT
jgi:hypothetical protein